MTETLLRIHNVRDICTLSRTEIYRRLSTGQFPAPVAIGRRSVAWRSSDIQAWIAARMPKVSAREERSHA